MSAIAVNQSATAQSSSALEGSPANNSCARACLKKFADDYAAAMLKHDVAAVPVSSNVKVTENAVAIKLGEGSWKNARKFFSTPSSTQYVADVEAGQIARMGIIDVDGKPAFHAVRLKVVNNKITEIETLYAPETLARPFQPEGYLWREAPFVRDIPMPIRSSRQELLKTASAYWSVATSTHKGNEVPYSVDCIHVENGMNTDWERPLDSIEAITPLENPQSMFDGRIWTCEREVNLTTRTFDAVRGLRYLVDEERGLVLAWNIVDKNSTQLNMVQELNGVKRTSPEYGPPSRGADGWPSQGAGGPPPAATTQVGAANETPSLYHAALMRIVNGRIHREQFFQVNVAKGTAAPF
ncbi:MAG: hypothetical protein QM808_14415 [Steroidobacteraceae bacterium]